MLTYDRLVKLYRELEEEEVLSVYVNGDQHDPAQRDAWHTRLESGIAALRRRIESLDDEEQLGRFERAWEHIARELRPHRDAFLPNRGWVGFATPERLEYAEPISAAMPDLVRWERGLRVAPYVRALKQQRPVFAVLVDSRRARLFEHVDGEIQELESHRADTYVGDLSDVGVRKMAQNSTGMRGKTSTDHAQRILDVATERMVKDVAATLEERAGSHGLVVVGGTSETSRHMKQALEHRFGNRVAERSSLRVDMTMAELREELRAAAGDMSEEAHLRLVDDLANAARSGARASLGVEATERALHEGRVDRLLLSRDFIRDHPDRADDYVGAAFAQGADVDEVSGEAGARLDQEGSGMAARLRFRTEADAVSSPDGARSSVG